jgi:hypothetical protein
VYFKEAEVFLYMWEWLSSRDFQVPNYSRLESRSRQTEKNFIKAGCGVRRHPMGFEIPCATFAKVDGGFLKRLP